MPPPALTARGSEGARAADSTHGADHQVPCATAGSSLASSQDVVPATSSPSQPLPPTDRRTSPHSRPAPSSSQPLSSTQPSPSPSSSAAAAPSSSLPEPAQPQAPRSTGPIPPVPGYTGSTARSSPGAPTLEAPESAQVHAQVLGPQGDGAEDESSLEMVEPSPRVRAQGGRTTAAPFVVGNGAWRPSAQPSSARAGAPGAPRVLVPDSQSSSGAPPPLAAAADAARSSMPSSAGPALARAAVVVAAALGADSQGTGSGSGSGSGTSANSSLLSVSSAEAQRLVAAVEPFDTYDARRVRAGAERERAQEKEQEQPDEDEEVDERDDEWMMSQASLGILDDDEDDEEEGSYGDGKALRSGSTANGDGDLDELVSDGEGSDSQPFSIGDTQPFTQAPPRGAAHDDAHERRPRRVSLSEVESEGEADEAALEATSGSGTDGDDMRAIDEFVRRDALE